jgi:hypothetical protein
MASAGLPKYFVTSRNENRRAIFETDTSNARDICACVALQLMTIEN